MTIRKFTNTQIISLYMPGHEEAHVNGIVTVQPQPFKISFGK